MIPWYFLICPWYNRANTEMGISGLVPEITDLNLRHKWSIYPWTMIYSRVIYKCDTACLCQQKNWRTGHSPPDHFKGDCRIVRWNNVTPKGTGAFLFPWPLGQHWFWGQEKSRWRPDYFNQRNQRPCSSRVENLNTLDFATLLTFKSNISF